MLDETAVRLICNPLLRSPLLFSKGLLEIVPPELLRHPGRHRLCCCKGWLWPGRVERPQKATSIAKFGFLS